MKFFYLTIMLVGLSPTHATSLPGRVLDPSELRQAKSNRRAREHRRDEDGTNGC